LRDKEKPRMTHIVSKVNTSILLDFWTTNRYYVHIVVTNDCGYKDTYESLWIGQSGWLVTTGRYW
jgi:hypothetical protein